MSFSTNPFFSQKKGAIYSFILLVAVAAVIGILLVSALHARTIVVTPKWAGVSFANQSYNFTVTNNNGADINLVKITKPTGFVDIYCLNPVPSGWTCDTNGTKALQTFVQFSGATLAAGASVTFNVSSTTGSSAGEASFTIRTEDDQSAFNQTTVDVSIDTLPPKLSLMNVSDGTRILSSGEHLDGLLFLSNSTGKVTIVFNATDNESAINGVTLYYNASNISDSTIVNVSHKIAATYDLAFAMSNGSFGPGSLWNATLDGSNIFNGTRIVFTVVANDTARNGNVSNYTASPNSDRVYNFTIDAAAPRFEDVQILNFSQIVNGSSTGVLGINTTKTFGSLAGLEYILNSSLLLNVSALVSDGGGSGVTRVEIMNGSGVFYDITSIINGANGSSGSSTWSTAGMAITNFTRPNFNSDGLYNITFRFTDNVSNTITTNFSVEVDDTPPTGTVLGTNITVNGLLSEGNASAAVPTNGSVSLRLATTSNINNVTRNISVFGNRGLIFNLTFESGTPSGTSFWNFTIANITRDFCDILPTDGSTCNFRFNFSDALGRFNDSLNLTFAVDGIAPNVSILSPVSLLTNYSTSVLINVSVNDSVGPLRNVSYRWRNTTSGSEGTQSGGGNVSNWQSMTLNTGTNSQFNANGYWSGTLTISSLVDGNYTIEVNATDSAGTQNTTVFVAKVVFDSTVPLNISFQSPASNSFHRANLTIATFGGSNITAVANETENAAKGNQSGILNVSLRLENGSFSWPWLPSATAASSSSYAAVTPNNVNLTHWGGEPINGTNGNFTIRLNVTDTAGNQNTSVAINITIDTVIPQMTIIQPVSGINRTGNFTVNLTATESNVANVYFRWVNDSSALVVGSRRGEWVTMTGGAVAGQFNGTFTNFTDGYAGFFDGNYSIEFNITDKAGNQNATTFNSGPFVQLVLDNNQPLIAAMGTLADSNQTGDFVVNLTINDTGRWNTNLGKINTTNINASAFRLENTTFNSSWFSMQFETTDLTTTDSNRTNATFTFSSVSNGLYNIRFMINDTAGNQNNSVQVSRILLDNVAPGVALAAANLSPSPSGGAGLSGTLIFNATITDNIPLNISITNDTAAQGNKFGVFYRFESASVTTAWLPMMGANPSGFPTTLSPHSVVFNSTNATTSLADGDYKLRINATDSAGNQNTSVYIDITIQNAGVAGLNATNLTFLEGLWNGMANSSTGAYTFLLNTSSNATCRYSLDTTVNYYSDMASTMENNVSKEHRINFGPRSDVGSGGHTLYYACKSITGNYTTSDGSSRQFQFGIDTRNRWNVTIPGKTDNNWPNYFQAAAGGSSNGWSSFVLATGALEGTSLASAVGGYNVTNVLSSLLQGTAAGNFTRVYAYTASTNSWETFQVGRTSNSFINFTNQTTYWINATATERLEIN